MNEVLENLSRYQNEKRALIDHLRHFFLDKENVLAAWFLASSPPTKLVDGPTPAVEMEMVVNDEEYQTIDRSMEQRKEFVKNSGRILFQSILDTHALPIYVVSITEIFVIYFGEIAPHAVKFYWSPLSSAFFPVDYCELLFEKINIRRSESYSDPFAEDSPESTTHEEQVWRACTDCWRRLIDPIYILPRRLNPPFNDPVINSEKDLSHITKRINELERLVGVPETSREVLFQGIETPTIFAVANRQVDHLKQLNNIIALRGVNIAHADLPDQARKLIKLVEDVVRYGANNLPTELQTWKWSVR